MIFVAVYLEQLKNNESSLSYTNSLKFGNRFKIFLSIIPACKRLTKFLKFVKFHIAR